MGRGALGKGGLVIRFDAANIDETHHPHNKKYGFLSVNEGKTPFPRKNAPALDANMLRERLATLDRPSMDYDIELLPFRIGSVLGIRSDRMSSSGSIQTVEDKRDLFNAKRKKLAMDEFTLTKQRIMAFTLHPPLPDNFESTGRSRKCERCPCVKKNFKKPKAQVGVTEFEYKFDK